ncbi:MAG TPA: adenylate/guanylate cyclase domain-containing protein [Gaiellaceae bacterium]|nr:adenylate/guanylate cyclase domain-containing protein [Gaiellaceae bacterium]
MPEFPAGTVTFLFTDVEGSTKLLQELGDAYGGLLEDHRALVRDAFSHHNGVEVDTQGDAFFGAFPRAKDALAAAADVREALATGPVRVRMGLHTGEPLLTSQGYVGIDVHRAARIAAVGHGGQILVSQSTRDLVGGDGLRDLGVHRLKDLTAPERIYQLGDYDFPPLKSLSRSNLPVAATPLIGRLSELSELKEMVRGARLVTITGAGGSGKTRLAMQVAAELVDDFRDGAFFVPLAPVQDAALLGPTIAEHTAVRTLDDLGGAEALILLDNFEHLLAAADELVLLLARAPQLKLLVTSRARLRVTGEREFVLEPFGEADAVKFFLERARAARREVRFEPAVADICRRLDGLPLALELAASRVKVLDPLILLERLGNILPMLTGGPRDAPERQQTLRATLEWSYALLDARLQQALRRLAVFRGTFSLEAAERVGGADLDDLAGLVDWNLLKPVGDGRFLMLETIREYGLELLDASGETAAVRDRHLDFFLGLAKEAEPRLTGPDQREWYGRLRTEQDNIREALGYACDARDGERALMLAGTIWRFWWNRGDTHEADYWYARAFAIGERASVTARARAIVGMAHVDESRADLASARRRFEEAAGLFRSIGETRWLIVSLIHLVGLSRDFDDPDRAEQLTQEARELAEQTGDVRAASLITLNQARLCLDGDGDLDEIKTSCEEALEGLRSIADPYGVASALELLGHVALRRGHADEACAYVRESIHLSRSIDDRQSLASTLVLAAAAAFARSEVDVSARLWDAHEALCDVYGFAPAVEPWLDEVREAAQKAAGPRAGGAAELDLDGATELALAAVSV